MDTTRELRELEIARIAYPEQNFTIEDIKSGRVMPILDTSIDKEDEVQVFRLFHEKYGSEARHHQVDVFKGAEGYYIIDDEDEAREIAEQRPDEWLNTLCYFVLTVDDYEKHKGSYSEFFLGDEEYEYLVELSQIC